MEGVWGRSPQFIDFEITYFVIFYRKRQPDRHRGYNCGKGLPTLCAAALVYYANYNSGWRVLILGGNWNNGGNAGLFYFNANNTSSNSNSNVGARHLV